MQMITNAFGNVNKNKFNFLNYLKHSFALPDENDCAKNSSNKNQNVSKKYTLEIAECF
jgi:hypothetical protein